MKLPNRTKLTKRVVDALSPGPVPIITWDSEVSGFGVRVSPGGRKTYILKFRETKRRNGRQRMPSIGVHGNISLEEARSIARSWLAKIARGESPLQPVTGTMTFGELAEDFHANHAVPKKKPRSVVLDRSLLDRFVKPKLGTLQADAVGRKDVEKLHVAMRTTPTQANRVLALVSSIFAYGQRTGQIAADRQNPAKGIAHYKERARERFLTEDEVHRLLQTLDRHHNQSPGFCDALRLALHTGLRKSDVLSLEWAAVDLERQALHLTDTKSGKLSLPLSAQACTVLRSIHARAGGGRFVFPAARGDGHAVGLNKFWSKIRVDADLPGVRIHDLRHSFASAAASSGVSLLSISKLLGHKNTTMTRRYAHLADSELRAAANEISKRFSKAS